MPGSFDGMRISMRGIDASRKQMEVASNNISQASNENYTRQEARLVSLNDIFDGEVFLGQGVKVEQVVRIRDELLDHQIRSSSSASGYYDTRTEWLQRIESAYNEPSDFGVKASLTNFWDAWSELANDPEGLGTRANVLSQSQTLADVINNLDTKLEDFKQGLEQDLLVTVDKINQLLSSIGQLNNEIFDQEAGGTQQANNLRDNRDAALDELSKLMEIRYREENNGMVTILFGDRPAVWVNSYEGIKVEKDPLNHVAPKLFWEDGGQPVEVTGGGLKAILDLRKVDIPNYIAELNSFTSTLITSVNEVYANGAGLDPFQTLKSQETLDVLGVATDDTPLGSALGLSVVDVDGNTVTTTGDIHFSFYDENDRILRTQGVLIEATDTITSIIEKVRNIPGISISPITDDFGKDHLQIQFEKDRAKEVGFSISNNTGIMDTSGFLQLAGFDPDDKSSVTTAGATVTDGTSATILQSTDLTTLKNKYGVSDFTNVGDTGLFDSGGPALGLQGSFTLNAFQTNNSGDDWYHAMQYRIDVESTDNIASIVDKINLLTSDTGFAATADSTSGKITISNEAKIGEDGKILQTGDPGYGAAPFLRLSFANTYLYPQDPDDQAPEGYNGLGDNTGLFAKLQMNTFFSGSDAENIAVDSRIASADEVHAGYHLFTGSNQLAVDMNSLQYANLTQGGRFTIGEEFDNIVSSLGIDVVKADTLQQNESLILQSFLSERDSISGVNLDEELTNMILYQRVYEANARMLATLSEMTEEILNI